MNAPTAPTYDLPAEIATYGSIDAAILAADNDGAYGLLTDLLSRRAAMMEDADPALKASNLRQSARDLRARVQRLMAEEAEYAGRAAFRAHQGEAELAEQFARRASACLSLATRDLDAAASADAEADAIETTELMKREA